MTKKKNVGLAGILGMQSKPHQTAVEGRGEVKPTSRVKAVKPKVTKEAPKKAANAPTNAVTNTKSKALPKSKDTDFKLTGVYLRKTTVGQVKAQLELSEQDMSELVEGLLGKWLKTR